MTICHNCQRPISGEPVRTVAGEPAHSDCCEDPEDLADVTPGDVEGVREMLLDDPRLEYASPEAKAAWIDAVIAFDMALTNPEAWREREDEQPFGITD